MIIIKVTTVSIVRTVKKKQCYGHGCRKPPSPPPPPSPPGIWEHQSVGLAEISTIKRHHQPEDKTGSSSRAERRNSDKVQGNLNVQPQIHPHHSKLFQSTLPRAQCPKGDP